MYVLYFQNYMLAKLHIPLLPLNAPHVLQYHC